MMSAQRITATTATPPTASGARPDNDSSTAGKSIFATAKGRWLSVSEIEENLGLDTTPLSVSTQPPATPPRSGTLLLFDRNATRNYKEDGHEWTKKRNGTRIREDHVKLRVAGRYRVAGSYVHHATNPTMKRRAYHLVDPITGKAPSRPGIASLLTSLCDNANAGGSTDVSLVGMLGDAIADQRCLVLVHYLDTDLAAKNSADLTAQVMKLREESKETLKVALKAAKRERKKRKLLKRQQREALGMGLCPPSTAMHIELLSQNIDASDHQARAHPSRTTPFSGGISDDMQNMAATKERAVPSSSSSSGGSLSSSTSDSDSDSSSDSFGKMQPSQQLHEYTALLTNDQPNLSRSATSPVVFPDQQMRAVQQNMSFQSNLQGHCCPQITTTSLPGGMYTSQQQNMPLLHPTQQLHHKQPEVQHLAVPFPAAQPYYHQQQQQAPGGHQPPLLMPASISCLQNDMDKQATQIRFQSMLLYQQQRQLHLQQESRLSSSSSVAAASTTSDGVSTLDQATAATAVIARPSSSATIHNEGGVEFLWQMVIESADTKNSTTPNMGTSVRGDNDSYGDRKCQGQQQSTVSSLVDGASQQQGAASASLPTSFDIEGIFANTSVTSSVGTAGNVASHQQQPLAAVLLPSSSSTSFGVWEGGGQKRKADYAALPGSVQEQF